MTLLSKAILPKDFWSDEARLLIAVFKPKLQSIYLTAALLSGSQLGITLSWEKANEYAIDWATQHMDTLLSQLMKTTVEGAGPIIAEWIASPTKDMGDLHQSLNKIFNRDRASRIAVTETTRAFAEAAMKQYQDNGITEWRWNTNQDEMIIEGERRGVCVVCAPLNGKVVKIGESFGLNRKGEPIIKPPDAHVNDRCWVTPVVNISKLSKHLPGQHDQKSHGNQSVPEDHPFMNDLDGGPGPSVQFHGSSSEIHDKLSGYAYITDSTTEAEGYARGLHRGESSEGFIYTVRRKPGKWKDITSGVNDSLMEGSDVDETIRNIAREFENEGGRYLYFTHPSFVGDEDQNVVVSLVPEEDLIILKRSTVKKTLSDEDLQKHMGPGNHPSGTPQSVHSPEHQGLGTKKEKAQLRAILKFRGKDGERVEITKTSNKSWKVTVVDKEGEPLLGSYKSYSKAQLIKSGNLAIQDIEAEIWKEAPQQMKLKNPKARLRAIKKFKGPEGHTIEITKNSVDAGWSVIVWNSDHTIAAEFIGGPSSIKMDAIEQGEEYIKEFGGELDNMIEVKDVKVNGVKVISPKMQPGNFSQLDPGQYNAWKSKSTDHLSTEELVAIRRYGDGYYSRINSTLRGKGTLQGKEKAVSESLDKALSSSVTPVDMTVYRGLRINKTKSSEKAFIEFLESNNIGHSYIDHGYHSTSIKRGTSSDFAAASGQDYKSVIIEVEVPKGSKALPLGDHSGHHSEYEVLFPRDTEFQVLHSYYEGKYQVLKVRMK